MAYIDPYLMNTFRGRIRDPRCFARCCAVLRRCRNLRSPAGAYGLVDGLSRACGVPINAAQRDNAAQWLMGCGVDPRNPIHRRQMWNMVRGGAGDPKCGSASLIGV